MSQMQAFATGRFWPLAALWSAPAFGPIAVYGPSALADNMLNSDTENHSELMIYYSGNNP
jgi:hypothetical protein